MAQLPDDLLQAYTVNGKATEESNDTDELRELIESALRELFSQHLPRNRPTDN